MSLDPRDVAAPPDALAWICATDLAAGYWTSHPEDIDAAHARGVRVLPTEADEHGDRWLRGLTEPAHLADVLILADRVRTLITGIDRHHPPDVAPPAASAEPTRTTRKPPTHDDCGEGPARSPTARAAPDIERTARHADRWPPDPEDVLTAITDLLERGSQQYRAADTGMPHLNALWDRLDGDDKQLLARYEEHANRAAEHWGNDRFRLGFALGASRGVRWIVYR